MLTPKEFEQIKVALDLATLDDDSSVSVVRRDDVLKVLENYVGGGDYHQVTFSPPVVQRLDYVPTHPPWRLTDIWCTTLTTGPKLDSTFDGPNCA